MAAISILQEECVAPVRSLVKTLSTLAFKGQTNKIYYHAFLMGCCETPSCIMMPTRHRIASIRGKHIPWKRGASVRLFRDTGKSRKDTLVSVVSSLSVTLVVRAGFSHCLGPYCNLWEVWMDDCLPTIICSVTVKNTSLPVSCKHLHTMGPPLLPVKAACV